MNKNKTLYKNKSLDVEAQTNLRKYAIKIGRRLLNVRLYCRTYKIVSLEIARVKIGNFIV